MDFFLHLKVQIIHVELFKAGVDLRSLFLLGISNTLYSDFGRLPFFFSNSYGVVELRKDTTESFAFLNVVRF